MVHRGWCDAIHAILFGSLDGARLLRTNIPNIVRNKSSSAEIYDISRLRWCRAGCGAAERFEAITLKLCGKKHGIQAGRFLHTADRRLHQG